MAITAYATCVYVETKINVPILLNVLPQKFQLKDINKMNDIEKRKLHLDAISELIKDIQDNKNNIECIVVSYSVSNMDDKGGTSFFSYVGGKVAAIGLAQQASHGLLHGNSAEL